MKIQRDNLFSLADVCAGARFRMRNRASRRSEGGMATVLFIALLGIMMILVMAESRALFNLHREVKFLQQQQIKRLNVPTTNAVSITTPASK